MDISLITAPLLAGVLIIASHVPLGREVLGRGIIFIDLCIAQVAALGVVIAHALHLAESGWLSQVIAVVSALSAAALLAWTESRWQHVQEAIIGSLYVLSASLALLVLTHDPHGAAQLNQLLAGQILWTGYGDLWPLGLASAVVLTAWYGLPRYRARLFYFLFAIAITASVQRVGVFLVFASLILPALATYGIGQARGLLLGCTLGAGGYLLGLLLSLRYDLPAGPVIVCSLASLTLASLIMRPLTSNA